MRLGHYVLPSQHRIIWISCLIFLTLSYVPYTTAFIPQSSILILPTTLLNDTSLKYTTAIQLRTNWDGAADKDTYITTTQNWNIDSSSNIKVNTTLKPNQRVSNALSQTIEYDFLINSTDSTTQNYSSAYPNVLIGPWEHLWPNPLTMNHTINDQEVSLIYNTARIVNSTFNQTTTLNFNQTEFHVKQFLTSYTFTIGCG